MKNLPPEHTASMPLSAALAFVGGYTDAATFVITGIFAGHISGNAVLFPISAVTRNWAHAGLTGAAVLILCLGIAASSLLEAGAVRRGPLPPLSLAILVEAGLYFIPGIPIALRHPLPDSASLLPLCFAMGLQTGSLRRTNGVSIYTAFMAGMVARLSEGETDRLEGRRTSPAESNVPVLAKVFAAFMVGAFGGAAMAVYVRPFALLAGGSMLLALAPLHTFAPLFQGTAPAREGRRGPDLRTNEERG